MELKAPKPALRRMMRQRREQLGPGERTRRSRLACESLCRLTVMQTAAVVAGFVAAGSEVDPLGALLWARSRGAVVVLPRVQPDARPRLRFHRFTGADGLRRGAFGVWEPAEDSPQVPHQAVDVFVAPGLAFDERGGRLGYGGGYYDELGAAVTGRGVLVGLGFEAQVVPSCPTDAGDVPVQFLVTEARAIPCANAVIAGPTARIARIDAA